LGMFLAFFILIYKLPEFLSVGDALHVAGKMGKLETLDFSFDFGNRYTIWSGIFGAIFLSLSYFGADQSQVQRYLGGKNITEIRTGLMFNALLKIPMQFFILLLGVFVFIFYQFERPPVFFNHNELEQLKISVGEESVNTIDDEYGKIHLLKQDKIKELVIAMDAPGEDQGMVDHKVEELMALENQSKALRVEVKDMMLKNDPDATTKDYDYVFITFVMTYLPKGVIGLLIAVILSAAMSSVSSELNALGSTTVIDFYKRSFKKDGDEKHYVLASRLFTMFWGIIAIIFALTASLVENLIEFVNIVGSVFYGTVLGIFLVAFFIKFVKGNALFIAALISQTTVIILHYLTTVEIIKLGYLWYNMIGCLLLILLSVLLQLLMTKKNNI
ncbi:MAG: sodium:solute symporter, partial [Cyclobacteriaceae bacterium]|nr:sodium:solute symporter [Cyclobacteriaceae bacterium]